MIKYGDEVERYASALWRSVAVVAFRFGLAGQRSLKHNPRAAPSLLQQPDQLD